MWNRPLGMSIEDNPLMESPFVQQFDVGVSSPPPPLGNLFLLTDNSNFLLTDNSNLLLTT